MTTLTDLLKQTRELRAKTSEARRFVSNHKGDHYPGCGCPIIPIGDFQRHAANNIDKICRAAEVLREALIGTCRCRGIEYRLCDNCEALAKADEIAGGKE